MSFCNSVFYRPWSVQSHSCLKTLEKLLLNGVIRINENNKSVHLVKRNLQIGRQEPSKKEMFCDDRAKRNLFHSALNNWAYWIRTPFSQRFLSVITPDSSMKTSSPWSCPSRRLTSPIKFPFRLRICIFPENGCLDLESLTVSIPLIRLVSNWSSASETVPVQILELPEFNWGLSLSRFALGWACSTRAILEVGCSFGLEALRVGCSITCFIGSFKTIFFAPHKFSEGGASTLSELTSLRGRV